jgi:Mg2+-importing ATPase
VRTGLHTAFGSIAQRLATRPPVTEFDRGVRRFGYLLTVSMLLILVVVFAVHVINGRPAVETLLFSVALAVGLSPELLPAILTVNLARGAQLMARDGVLVRHLNAIENLGSMDVLCTDKTGTITEGVVSLEGAYDGRGVHDAGVHRLAALNAALETGLHNPLDDAILAGCDADISDARKAGEIPFDFVRKRVTIGISSATGGETQLIAKGAFHQVLEVCSTLTGGGALDDAARASLEARYQEWSARGIRVMAVATRMLAAGEPLSRTSETGMTFVGFVTFLDQPKPDAAIALRELARLGVSVKIITGDASPVARHTAALVGLASGATLTGRILAEMTDEALWHMAERTAIFAEVDPNQKERIIRALRKTGHVVGFMGDGVNDTPAMHAADTSLSVDTAVDVARETADFVLLERDLDVIRRGIEEGRRTFANTLKYILTTMSANLGNMVSMAAASLLLPFLPLLPGQILLNNFLSDVPAMGIATDSVDSELIATPQRWNLRFIWRFMAQFGALSSVFDLMTFVLLLGFFRVAPAAFRTGWFIESLLTELVIALVVRTRRAFYRSRPGRLLLWSTLALVVLTGLVPYLPGVSLFGFVHLPASVLGATLAITALYVTAAELLKKRFYRA